MLGRIASMDSLRVSNSLDNRAPPPRSIVKSCG
jgi:hypothetical protein